jgi:hypothetical protein
MQMVDFDFPMGDRVWLPGPATHGIVTGLCYDAQGKCYKIAFWKDGARSEMWLMRGEVQRAKSQDADKPATDQKGAC